MKAIRRALVVTALTVAASGCAVINPNYYHNVPTAEICRGLLTLPSYNVNHPARMAELARRGESCGSPAEIAAAQRHKDAEAAELLKAMTPPPPAPAPAPVTCRWIGYNWVCM
jgi:hypothetical protein